MATEAAWLNGKKERKTHVKSKSLLTGIGLLMEGPSKSEWPRTGLMAHVQPLMFAVVHLMRRQLISTWEKEKKSRAESSYLSSAPRSQLASVAAAEYVLWQNSSNEAVGDSAFRTSSYMRRNSPSCPL